MKNKYFYAIIASSLLTLFSCGAKTQDADNDQHDKEAKEETGHANEIVFNKAQAKAANLKLETVQAAPFNYVIKASGQIQSPQGNEQTVVATAAGVVSFANSSIAEGVSVHSGETLVTISSKNLQDGDPNVKARLAYEAAEKEYRRAERLIADKILSAKEFEQARLSYETAKAVYLAQAGSVSAAGVRVAAGMGGYIKQLLVSQGSYVSVGQPIAVITQTRRLQLKVMVAENQYPNLSGITSANFKTSHNNDAIYKLSSLNGRLVSYGRSTSENSSFIPVIFEFDNVGDFLPGSYADVFLLGKQDYNVISLPISAVTEEQGLYFVYVQIEPEAYMKRQVTLGENDGERVVIKEGLKSGEHVVVNGAYNVKLASTGGAIPHGHSH